MITIQGKGVSAGVGVGPLYYYRRATAGGNALALNGDHRAKSSLFM